VGGFASEKLNPSAKRHEQAQLREVFIPPFLLEHYCCREMNTLVLAADGRRSKPLALEGWLPGSLPAA